MKETSFERTEFHGIRVHVLPTDQFKTFALSVYIGAPLAESTVTNAALTPFVLRRGTEKLPETKQFREKLDELYGAGFGFDIYKRGDYQMVQFRMDIVNDQFVSSAGSLLQDGIAFLADAILNPALEQGAFRAKYVQSEKDTLRKRIESIVNDKIKYAAERCIEEMCRNEPYRLHPLGKIEHLEQITPQSLYDYYRQWLASAPIDLYVVGNTTLQEVLQLLERSLPQLRSANASYTSRPAPIRAAEVNTVIERFDVTQGKLNMGLRIPVTYGDDAYAAALMYNGILGGYPHSKLFTNVREKASLAYYASSRYDGHKGIMTIQSGIEIQNYEKAVDIIRRQLDDMSSGVYSDSELSQTKAMIVNHLRELQDSAFETISFDFNAILSGKERTVPELIAAVEAVTPEQIKAVAGGVQLDTIYFLTAAKGE
ncbi:zinc protease [Gordoniibacillus kamchatkensis]|uniref:Zinc protease n=1 Tax=Gordoniibacillus kamchatkensis TaxID=1590651 RepID=A0ABR5AM17_9BACL|nr:pitrilysin family protein [Paenibacillus sp. VKM B-2647]KIL41397.1 zinc protease [Paenibacillus sp. VKM B-2647]